MQQQNPQGGGVRDDDRATAKGPKDDAPVGGGAKGPASGKAGQGQADHAGSGNSLGDGRTAGGADREAERDRLTGGKG
ncbi:hypothetical protein [Aquabacterium sp. J223]|uniref:hypothetical protein n=1 Tax=Aquabacterium sp. J223 TaxID=2898431 RepID=UPI0021ADBFDA|nr:hypothetical protein [Aquabacterium sp. J223]UUX95621.1 hypothetical protein LRS07_20875 [Aquabacterium sp. J223]